MTDPKFTTREELEAHLYSADLIPNYATIRAETWSPTTGKHVHAYYDPPTNGIHICAPDMNDAAATAARYPMGGVKARRLFALAKAAAECPDDAEDFVVDLCIDGQIIDDFGSNRQLWSHAIAEWNRVTLAHGHLFEEAK